jgi:hypothetical protein
MKGSLTVLSWSKLKDRQEIELQIVQKTKELVSAIKGVTLNELDFSYLNHDYSRENILLSYDGFNIVNGSVQSKNGYIYPLVDYGKDDSVLYTNEWRVEDLRPCLFIKEIVDNIFRTAGKTYTSNFFDSPYWNSLILLNTQKEIDYTDDQKAPYQTNVTNSTTQETESGTSFPAIPGNVEQFDDIRIDTIVTDPSLQWDISNPDAPTVTAQTSGKYQFTLKTDITFSYALDMFFINLNSLPTQPNPRTIIQGAVTQYLILKKNGTNFTNFAITNTPLDTVFGSGSLQFLYQDQSTQSETWSFDIDLPAGDVLKFQILRDEYIDSGVSPYLYPRFVLNNTRITSELIKKEVGEGDEINFLNYIPVIKADEFIDTIFNAFNLWVIDNPYQEDDLIIEPRTNFFDLGGFVNWSDKLDVSRELKNLYLADELPKRFIYKFDKSEDVLSKRYFEENQEGYADYISEVPEVDLSRDDQEIKTKLTPLIAQESDGLIYPQFFAQDEGSTDKRSIKNFLKIGFVNKRQGAYFLTDQTGQNVQNEYIVCSEFDDPQAPTYSLTFGEPETDLPQTSPAYWNLFRLFHKLTEEEKTRKGAKIVEAFIYLNENDINQLDLRRVIFINQVYYRLVSIDNYDPTTSSPTKVKLLQIDVVKYDFTSNDIIYKQNQGFIKLLSNNKDQAIQTNKNKYVTV